MGNTGNQGALFSAPVMAGQDALFGGTFAIDGDDLDGQADELAADVAHMERVARQRIKANERHAELRAHRLGCGNCIPGGRGCRDGRKAEQEARISRDALRALLDGTL